MVPELRNGDRTMKTIDDVIAEYKAQARDEGAWRTRFYWFWDVYGTLVFPAFALLYPKIPQATPAPVAGAAAIPNAWSQWALPVLVLAVVLQCAALMIKFSRRKLDSTEYVLRLEELMKIGRNLLGETNRSKRFNTCLYDVSQEVYKISNRLESARDVPLREIIGIMLSPLCPDLEKLFGFKDNSCYSFHVYIHNPDEKVLEPVFRYRHPVLVRQKPEDSRAWPERIGHVGKCFALGRELIIEDIQNDKAPEAYRRPGDDAFYRGAMAVPLLHAAEDASGRPTAEVFGALILTSSAPGQFGKDGDDPNHNEYMLRMRVLQTMIGETIYDLTRPDLDPDLEQDEGAQDGQDG